VEDTTAWDRAITYPPPDGRVLLAVGVGPKSGEFDRRDVTIALTLFQRSAMWWGFVALLLVVAVLVMLAWQTAILRDDGVGGTFSLARCQMAWWLCIVTASFVFIWLVTGQYNGVMTPDALVLLGISGTTALAAATIDGINQAGAPPAVQRSAGLLTDIVSEGGSPAVHRVQIVIWTLLLGVVFLWQVYSRFRFPSFDASLLVMMGVSGGFYLGFKTKEK
jgi:magnesium-transporting ATPase (P-type)